jgi:hypothetical protein
VADAMAQDPNGYRLPPRAAPPPSGDPNSTVQDFTLTPAGGYAEQPPQAVPQGPTPEGQVQDIELPGAPAQAAPAAPPAAAASGAASPDGVVTVPGADGQPVRVALSGLSPEKRAEYGGMADVNAFGRGVAGDWGAIRRDQDKAAETERQAIRDQAGTQAIRQDEEYRLRRKAQEDQAKLEAAAAEDQTHYQAVANQRDSDMQKLTAEQGNMTFDPDRYQKSRSAGQNFLSAISIALGGIGQAMIPGSRNVGLDLLNHAADNDVLAQQEAYSRKGAQINQAQNAYGRARQLGMDHQQATLAARQVALQQLETGLKVVGSKYASKETMANRDQALAHVGMELAKTKADYAKTVHAEASQFIALRQQQRAFTANRDDEQWNRALELGKLGIEGQRADAAAQAAAAKAQKEALTIPGWQGEAKTKEAYNKAADAVGSETMATTKLKELIAFGKGNGFLDPKQRAKAQGTVAELQGVYRNLLGLGVMSDSDKEFLQTIIRDPTSITWTPAVTAQLDNVMKHVHQDTDAKLGALGLSRDKNVKQRSDLDEEAIAGAQSE